jgi:hypothetical protein
MAPPAPGLDEVEEMRRDALSLGVKLDLLNKGGSSTGGIARISLASKLRLR